LNITKDAGNGVLFFKGKSIPGAHASRLHSFLLRLIMEIIYDAHRNPGTDFVGATVIGLMSGEGEELNSDSWKLPAHLGSYRHTNAGIFGMLKAHYSFSMQ